jgi:hypothetical protein
MNRITQYIDDVSAVIAAKDLSKDRRDALSTALDMSLGEFSRLQDLKSLAAGNSLTSEEAMTLLSESLARFNDSASIAAKVAMTHLLIVLINWSHDTSKPIEFSIQEEVTQCK